MELGQGSFRVSSGAPNHPVQGYLNTGLMSKLSGSITRIPTIILVCRITLGDSFRNRKTARDLIPGLPDGKGLRVQERKGPLKTWEMV